MSPGEEVICIACGRALPRSEAREYDKHGDRWERDGKRFEYLCKPCFRDTSKESREGLEGLLTEIGAGRTDPEEFLRRYLSAVEGHRADETEADND